jgi:hypothetical protein
MIWHYLAHGVRILSRMMDRIPLQQGNLIYVVVVLIDMEDINTSIEHANHSIIPFNSIRAFHYEIHPS